MGACQDGVCPVSFRPVAAWTPTGSSAVKPAILLFLSSSPDMRRLSCLTSAVCVSFLLCPSKSAHAGTNLTTMVVEAGGTDWTAAIWKTNGTGTAVSPVTGNTYEAVFNGTSIGNGTANTRI